MKYKLIHKQTGEEHLCEKIDDGFDYYANYPEKCCIQKEGKSLMNKGCMERNHCEKFIATNNPNIDVPKVVDETWIFFKEVDGTCKKDQYEHWLYKSGYNKSQETHPFSEENMIEFAEWASKYDWVFMADRNYWVNDDSRLHPKSTKELLQLWKEQRTKIVYYE